MNDERIGKPIRWNPSEIKGDANLFFYDPKPKRWVLKKSGPNDGEMLVSFPKGFKGERDAIVVGSEGGLSNIHIEVK